MSKENAKIVKFVGKNKVNKYTIEECNSELSRLGATAASRYGLEVKKQLFVLTHVPTTVPTNVSTNIS